jgi:glycosyltransferase involved in cell wall biosynthesis
MLFSIIIPIYNTQDALPECLKSIQAQTYSDFEVIMVNDGSTDRSGEICTHFSEMDKRFRAIHKPNGGVSSARNRGIELASGQYVTFIDSDDYISSDYLASVKAIIDRYQPDGVVNGCYKIDHIGEITETAYAINADNCVNKEQLLKLMISHQYPSALWMSIYRGDIVKKHCLDLEMQFYEDLDYQISLANELQSIRVNHTPGYFYRTGSNTHKRLTEKTVTCFKLIEKLRNRADVEPELVDGLEADFIISTALLGAIDRQHDEKLDRIIYFHASSLQKCGFLRKRYSPPFCWIHIIAISPKLYYFLYRLIHPLKERY